MYLERTTIEPPEPHSEDSITQTDRILDMELYRSNKK